MGPARVPGWLTRAPLAARPQDQYVECSYGKTLYNSAYYEVLGPVNVTCIGGLPQPWPPGGAPPRPPPRSTPSLTRRNATYT
jgi:hypothetical protein